MPYAPPPVAGHPAEFRSPRGLAVALVVLLSGCLAVELLVLALTGSRLSVLSGMGNRAQTFQEAEDARNAEEWLNIGVALRFLAVVCTGVVFIVWQYRVRTNADALTPGVGRLGRGWAIGGWFIPLGNLWLPFDMIRELWRDSTPWGGSPRANLVVAWWVACAGSVVAFGFSGGFTEEDTDIAGDVDGLRAQAFVLLLSDVFGVAAAILAILVVHKLTSRQLARHAHGGPQTRPAPVPYAYPYLPQQPVAPPPPPLYASPVTSADADPGPGPTTRYGG
jgi:hypothetical protein